jgi:hypothetical protein
MNGLFNHLQTTLDLVRQGSFNRQFFGFRCAQMLLVLGDLRFLKAEFFVLREKN